MKEGREWVRGQARSIPGNSSSHSPSRSCILAWLYFCPKLTTLFQFVLRRKLVETVLRAKKGETERGRGKGVAWAIFPLIAI